MGRKMTQAELDQKVQAELGHLKSAKLLLEDARGHLSDNILAKDLIKQAIANLDWEIFFIEKDTKD